MSFSPMGTAEMSPLFAEPSKSKVMSEVEMPSTEDMCLLVSHDLSRDLKSNHFSILTNHYCNLSLEVSEQEGGNTGQTDLDKWEQTDYMDTQGLITEETQKDT